MSDLARRLGGVLRSAQDRTLGRRAVRAGLLTDAELSGPFQVDELLQMKGVAPERIKELHDEVDREDYALFRPDRVMPPEVSEVLAEPDRRLSEFIRVNRLGQGGVGEVWKAWDSRLGRWVAIKLPMAAPDQEGTAERFSREALAAARLAHPNIVSIHRVAEENGRCFIVMQYVEGQSLRGAKLDTRKALEVLRDVALAVHYAHDQGVIHRDLKPGNILIGSEGRPFVLDFGLAHLQQAGRVQSREGLVAGTAAYMSPEQARGEPAARERATDVYSLGATLYEVVTGRAPFDGATFAETLEKVLHREPAPPRSIVPTLAVDIEAVILKAMDKDPKRRYATAKEFADDLDRCLRSEPVAARRSAFTRRIRVGMRQNPWLAWVGAGLVLAALGVGAWRSVSESNALVAATRERDREIQATADMARLSIDAMLTLRRAGANDGMKEFLSRIEAGIASARAKDYATPELESLLGVAYRAAMMNGKALEAQQRALSAAPHLRQAEYERFILGRIGTELPPGLPGDAVPVDLEGAPEGPERLTLAGCAAMRAGNYPAARQDLEKAVSLDPNRTEAWETLAAASRDSVPADLPRAERENRCRKAEEVYTRALKQDRGYLPFWMGRAERRLELANLLGESGQDPVLAFQGADEDYSEALRLRPSTGAYIGRAQVRTLQAAHHASLGENPQKGFEEAAADLELAARLNPKDPGVLVGRSLALRSRADYQISRMESPLRDLEELEGKIAEAMKDGPVPPEAWMNYGLIWSDQALYRAGLGEDPASDFSRAEEAFGKIQEPCPGWHEKRARMRVERARLRPRQQTDPAMHDVDLALEDLSFYSSIHIPSNEFGITRAMARRTKGTLMIACGQDPTALFQGARSDLDQVLESNPVSAAASAERGHLELAWGRYRTKLIDRSGALDHYGRSVRAFEEAIRSNDTLATPLREWLREARRGLLGAY